MNKSKIQIVINVQIGKEKHSVQSEWIEVDEKMSLEKAIKYAVQGLGEILPAHPSTKKTRRD